MEPRAGHGPARCHTTTTTSKEVKRVDVERRQKRILDVGLIGRALQDFARLVGLLSLEDQKGIVQFLVYRGKVLPHDLTTGVPPAERDTLTTRIRT